MVSPGLLEKHYSPRAPLTLYEGPLAPLAAIRDAAAARAAGRRIGLLLASDDPGGPEGPPLLEQEARALEHAHMEYVGPTRNPALVAANLYAALRRLDAHNLDAIYARGIDSPDGLAVAICDRLRRAAAGRIVRT
jgi:L-threonylcarbamoyladenylate synthase